MNRSGFSRRELIARFGLALPLVPLLSTDRLRAAEGARRLCIIQWTNGALTAPFWPGGTETDWALPKCLEPLAPFKNDILVLRGLRLQAAQEDPLGAAGHQSLPHLLTGAKGTKSNVGDTGSHIMGNAISIDQHVAKDFAARKLTPLASLELAVQRGRTDWISFKGPAKGGFPDALTPLENPYDVWKKFFQGQALGKDELERIRARRQLVLDAVNPDLKALRRSLGTDDKLLLDEHLAAIEGLQKEVMSLDTSTAQNKPGCMAPALLAGVDPKDRSKYPELTRMQLELMVTAFRCDITRVSTLMLSNSNNQGTTFTWLGDEFLKPPNEMSGVSSGTMIGHHEIAHAAGDKPNDAMKIRVDTWFVEQFAYLLKRLKETPDPYGGGSLLDNTAVLFANHMDNGAGHGVGGDIPFILGGRAGGYFKTGRSLRWATRLGHNGLLASLGNAMGVSTPSFGDFNTTSGIESRLRG